MTTAEGTLLLLYPPYLDVHGYSLPVIGALVALLSVMRLASRVPVGAAYGAARAKRMLAIALVGLSVATGGFAFAGGHILPVLVLTLLHGFAFGSLGTLVLASVIDITRGRRAGAIMAWYTAALSTGYATGAFAGGWLGDTIGLEPTMLLAAALPLLALPLVRALPAFEAPPDQEVRTPGLGGLIHAARTIDGRVWLAFGIVLYLNVVSEAVDAFFPLYGLEIGIPLAAIGFLKGLKSGAATVIRFASIVIFRVVDPRAMNFWGVVLMGVSTILLAHTSALAALAVLFIFFGLCRGVLRVTSAATVAELRREGRDVGLAAGVYNSGLDIGQIIGPLAGGVIGNAFGLAAMFQVMAVASMAVYFGVALSSSRARAALSIRLRPARAEMAALTEAPAEVR